MAGTMAKYNESLFPTDCCYLCKTEIDLVRHEIFHGSRRDASKEWGCWVTLCPRCHMDIHSNPAKYRWLQTEAYQLALIRHRWTEEDFRDVFGKTY